MKTKFLFSATVLSVLFLFSINAQTPALIIGWEMQGVSGNAASATAQFMVPGIQTTTSGVITRGSGLTPVSLNNCFRSSNWSQGTTVQAAVADNSYLRFVVAPSTGYSITILSLDYTFQTTQTGPSQMSLRSSTDGFQTFLDHGTLNNTVSTDPIKLKFLISNVIEKDVPVEFRLYGYSASGSSGRGQLQNSAISQYDPYDVGLVGYLTLDSSIVIQCPTAVFSLPSSSCLGEPVSFIQQSTTPAGTTIVSYNWNFGDGNTSTQASPTHTFFQAGTFNVRLIVTNSDFCSDTVIRPIIVNTQLTVTINPISSSYCENHGSVTLTGNPSGGVFAGAGVSGNAFNPAVAGAGGPYNISYQVGTGACSGSASVVTSVIPSPVSAFTYTKDSLEVTFTNTSTDATQYLWEFGDGNSSTVQNPLHTFSASGNYEVCLTATSATCEDIHCENITVSVPQDTTTNSINENILMNVRLYPVPFQHVLSIELNDSRIASVKITNLAGRVFYHEAAAAQSLQINTGDWSAGMYLIFMETTDGNFSTQKIVKQ